MDNNYDSLGLFVCVNLVLQKMYLHNMELYRFCFVIYILIPVENCSLYAAN